MGPVAVFLLSTPNATFGLKNLAPSIVVSESLWQTRSLSFAPPSARII